MLLVVVLKVVAVDLDDVDFIVEEGIALVVVSFSPDVVVVVAVVVVVVAVDVVSSILFVVDFIVVVVGWTPRTISL